LSASASYETDILITEELSPNVWKPRIIIEAKLSRVTTHDSNHITAKKHQRNKHVHPIYVTVILIGNRQQHPLPGRLFRHGSYFRFHALVEGLET
jgi:hypothetical protein